MNKILLMRYTEQERYNTKKFGAEIMLDNPTQKQIILVLKKLKKEIKELK